MDKNVVMVNPGQHGYFSRGHIPPLPPVCHSFLSNME